MIQIVDDNGYHWTFDGERVYCVEAEEEEPECNGYPCESWEEAIELLTEYDYITVI